MKILLDTAEEKSQLLGTDMSNMVELNIQQKMVNLLSLKTLNIDIHKVLCTWEEF